MPQGRYSPVSTAISDRSAASSLFGTVHDAVRLSSLWRTDSWPIKDGDTTKRPSGSSSMLFRLEKRVMQDSISICSIEVAPGGYLDPHIEISCRHKGQCMGFPSYCAYCWLITCSGQQPATYLESVLGYSFQPSDLLCQLWILQGNALPSSFCHAIPQSTNGHDLSTLSHTAVSHDQRKQIFIGEHSIDDLHGTMML